MIIRTSSYARAGLIGNPSDGYFGKTISFIVRNYRADIVLWETPEIEIMPSERDHSTFSSLEALRNDVNEHGYYGGVRLLKATAKKFFDYCDANGIDLIERNFTLQYSSNIPSRVGMAGSSAIITAALRALMTFYGVRMPRAMQANLILSVENDELKIPAGLQDRVIQAYEGLVFMDFDRDSIETQGFGNYEELDPASLPPLYVAFGTNLSEGTEVFHNDIRARFRRGDQQVIDAMQQWAAMAQTTRDLLVAGKGDQIGPLLNANFDLRRDLYQISAGNIRMVEVAREVGATAKFTGSGGAIVGTYEDEKMFEKLKEKLGELQMEVIKPQIFPEE